MILLRRDCLVFETSTGDRIPCSAHEVIRELLGNAAEWLDQDWLEHAAHAVLHYFQVEQGQTTVTLAEFSRALERVLRGLGLVLTTSGPAGSSEGASQKAIKHQARVIEADLRQFADESVQGCELLFFPGLGNAV